MAAGGELAVLLALPAVASVKTMPTDGELAALLALPAIASVKTGSSLRVVGRTANLITMTYCYNRVL